MSQRELAFQNHIIDSYAHFGGHAKKWATEWQVGNPDLVCSLPGYGVHLAEVKHLPFLERVEKDKNPLRPKQKQVCRTYRSAGGLILAYIVSGDNALRSFLYAFDPNAEFVSKDHPIKVPYTRGEKYNIPLLLSMWKEKYL